MHAFVLLDRTGSMAGLWGEAVSSINAYVDELKKTASEDDRVTLAVFDHFYDGIQFNVLRDGVSLKNEWIPFDIAEVAPRGATPLFDALVRIIGLAEKGNDEKTVIVVMTDGHENASSEVNRTLTKAAIERVQKRNWQLVFLGANFDAFDQAAQVGIGAGQTVSMSPGTFVKGATSTARSSRHYAATGDAIMYTEQDRADVDEQKVKKR